MPDLLLIVLARTDQVACREEKPSGGLLLAVCAHRARILEFAQHQFCSSLDQSDQSGQFAHRILQFVTQQLLFPTEWSLKKTCFLPFLGPEFLGPAELAPAFWDPHQGIYAIAPRHHSLTAHGPDTWSLPGGLVDLGSTSRVVVHRSNRSKNNKDCVTASSMDINGRSEKGLRKHAKKEFRNQLRSEGHRGW